MTVLLITFKLLGAFPVVTFVEMILLSIENCSLISILVIQFHWRGASFEVKRIHDVIRDLLLMSRGVKLILK